MGKDLKGRELGKGLSQRKDGLYTARYTDNFGKRHSIYDPKLSVVRQKMNEALYTKNHSIFSKHCNMTLSEWFDTWVDVFYKNTVKTVTYLRAIANYDRYIRNSYLGDMKITDIKPVHIQKFINELIEEKSLTRSGIKPYANVLRASLKKAYECGYLQADPAEGITLPKRNSKFREAMTPREQELFFIYAQGSSYYDLFRFLLLTGVRIGEAIALTWEDINMEERTISINKTAITVKGKEKDMYKERGYETACNRAVVISSPKTANSIRILPISDACHTLLEHMNLKREPKINLLFYSKNKSYLNHSNIDARLKAICNLINERSGEHIKSISAHTFRHTFATRCFELNVNIKTVQYLLGHSSAETTMDIYTHISTEQAKKEIQAINTLDLTPIIKMA